MIDRELRVGEMVKSGLFCSLKSLKSQGHESGIVTTQWIQPVLAKRDSLGNRAFWEWDSAERDSVENSRNASRKRQSDAESPETPQNYVPLAEDSVPP